MDPNATLYRIQQGTDPEEISEDCSNLAEWISRGGFKPEWHKYPKGALEMLS